MSIVVEDFHKVYDQTVAVSGLSFEVEPGEILGLVGPNGAGKTTTMRTLAGILEPTSGRLAIAGHDVKREPVAAKTALAYVPDDPHLFDNLTVWEHFQFIASAYRLKDWAGSAETLLSQFELTEKRDAPCSDLSRGMRQKVAICCGYLHEPKVIMLDEPLTGLDPRGIRTMQDVDPGTGVGGGGGDGQLAPPLAGRRPLHLGPPDAPGSETSPGTAGRPPERGHGRRPGGVAGGSLLPPHRVARHTPGHRPDGGLTWTDRSGCS